jgi:dTDP-4-dehydrorhamnose reductase
MMTLQPGKLRILVTGRDGQVGRELASTMAALGEVTATSRADLDLVSDDSIRVVVQAVKPHILVNAAAYTAVDKAESEPELAWRINADAVASLAAEAKTVGAAMIHYSTDYVFDGTKTSAYREDDATHPLSVYGKSKLAGEQVLADAGIPWLVLRTSWVYGAQGKNFLLTILRLAQEKPELRIVADQTGAPTWSRDIATATAAITAKWQADNARSGVYHLTASGSTTWYRFATRAVELLAQAHPGACGSLARLVPISTAEYPTAAARPHNSQLDSEKLAREFGVRLPEWDRSLAEVMEEYELASSAAQHG